MQNVQDMDELVFPLLSSDERTYVCQKPWTPEIGKEMTRLTRECVKIHAGKPVFGTVVLESDLLIHLRIGEYVLQQRTKARGVSYEGAKAMALQIEQEVRGSGIHTIEFIV